ncbi:gliding motility-associated C-terminal domain-containing protein [Mucilaginibacter antarcticus]|uniref:PKD domain-containing protein n=1 Tax=Mucilaginibacter antarcticus TaxID=1855725 RepID=A0ABW5XU65_9SPHI
MLSLIFGFCSNSYAQLCPTRPTAAFTFVNDTTTCLLRNVVKFTNTSTLNGSPITSWQWNFGDGETDNTPNPTHTYRAYGKFNVMLTVSSASCPSTSPVQEVSTLPTMRPAFDVDVQICPNAPVRVIDRSDSERPIKMWTVNYGDGTIVSYTKNTNWTHVYTKTGKYTISLTLTSTDAQACVSDLAQKDIQVSGVSFAICQSEETQFTDETDPVGTKGFTYNWDFGDPAGSTLTNQNTSRLKNPSHKYTNNGTYTATLTVSSPNGCVDAVGAKTFTIGVPVANFDIANKTSLCGADSVAFLDKTDTTSKIKRLVWFYDLVDHPEDSISITKGQMSKDKTYRHFYGVNNSNAPITYKARLITRIGGACPDPTLTMDVVIYPTPVVTLRINGNTFASPYALCLGAGAVNISAAANLPGTATFTGKGIVNGNIFDPAISGAGTFTITCIYTSGNTPCVSTSTFNIIVGSPVVTLPATVGVLEGKPTQLNPNVVGTGTNLTFAWSPTTGISDPTTRNPFFSPTQDTKYTLEVTAVGGCKSSATVMVNVLKTPIVPNTFTPNNDGINDTWSIQYLNTYTAATVEVFNRNGARVYYSNGYPKPWDGTVNNSVLPIGVYYYVINPRSGRPAIVGSLTIIK